MAGSWSRSTWLARRVRRSLGTGTPLQCRPMVRSRLHRARSRRSATSVPATRFTALCCRASTQFVHKIRSGSESRSSLLPARGHAQARCQVGLASAAFADQHHRFGTFNVTAFGQLADLRRRNLPRLVEVELLQRFHSGQLGIAQPLLNGVPVAFFRLHGEQRFQIADVTALFLDGLLRQLYEVRSDHRNAQRFAILLYAGVFESLSLLFHRATSAVLAAMLSNWSYSFTSGNGRS